MSGLRKQIEKLRSLDPLLDGRNWIERKKVLGLLADCVCIPRKQLEDYIDFVDRLRTHPKSDAMMVKYKIYKELLEDSKE